MKRVHLHLLSALHDHLHRMAGPKYHNAAQTAYLVVAREIAKLYLPDMHASVYHSLTARLFDIEQSAVGLARMAPLEYRDAWLCQDLRESGCMSDCEKAVELVSRICGNYDWAARHRKHHPLDSSYETNIGILNTLYDVANYYDAYLMFATDEDLLRYSMWFAGDMEEEAEGFYVRFYHDIGDDAEYEALLKEFPANGLPHKFMWRHDHAPCTPITGETRYKNISILDLEKYGKHCIDKLSKGDELCVVFTATRLCDYKSVIAVSQFRDKMKTVDGNT
ncbi:hypothetical protein BIZ83_gp059 [Erwinia phage vB_EamM_ChrisDB]|uniref:hypothetical protein n=1 Tax=Erwinia phage vB_EamM_ChrisDB TaxID=1883371 RepID=UPI00081C388C|nr:hypothetical protein BIZ83_gp059 [Erwinia phage vB_EamM_ChrisDB]ANZ48794.1 hypothetical protein CHRISDB_232 [Erwinia phage vB_EamM_ChrisDB]